MDGRSGQMDAQTTQKYIPLTSSVGKKQAKSNGNIDKKKKNKKKKIKKINSSSKIKTIE